MRIRVRGFAIAGLIAALASPSGCPLDNGPTDAADGLASSDYDRIWQITSETGLVNSCITILGDRVTQAGECNGAALTILDSDLSVRSGEQIIWTFLVPADNGPTRHTISVFVQPDGTLRGTYSLRFAGELLAITDDIIMVPRRVRI